jgi:predicted nucleic acid-binding Zn ribbon protein
MATMTCRDCGYLLPPDARGCPQCALNLEAERMIDRFVSRRLVPVLIVVGLAIVFALFYLIR